MVHSEAVPEDRPGTAVTAALPSLAPTLAPDRSVRVMVVDDHRVFAELLSYALTGAGHRVVGTVFSLTEAARVVGGLQPDVVVLDQNLPDGTGSNAVARLRRSAPEVRILMLTSQATTATLRTALESGCDGFVTKTRGMADVLAAVLAVARGETPIRTDLQEAPPTAQTMPVPLTPRELEVLELVCAGRANKEIATALGLSVNTVRNHIAHLLDKLGVRSKLEVVAEAGARGLLPGARPREVPSRSR